MARAALTQMAGDGARGAHVARICARGIAGGQRNPRTSGRAALRARRAYALDSHSPTAAHCPQKLDLSAQLRSTIETPAQRLQERRQWTCM